jgi:signal transduction histidine kinase
VFRTSIELIILTFITYMMTSEWLKSKSKQLRFLIYGFSFLAFNKLIFTLANGWLIFSKETPQAINTLSNTLLIFDNALEIIGILFIANAFIYPLFKKSETFMSNISHGVTALTSFFVLMQVAWGFNWGSIHAYGLVFYGFMEVLKLVLLSYPIYKIVISHTEEEKYYKNIIIAFAIYMVTPIVSLVNVILFTNHNVLLHLLSFPYPFLAVILFARVVYLKLVDKAMLRDELQTTKKKYEEEKEIGKMKDEFVSVVSHELRTPITSLKLYLSLFKEGKFGKVNQAQTEILNVLHDESNRLMNLINDVLTLAKMENKKLKLKLQNCDLHRLVSTHMYQNLTDQKNITVVNNIPQEFMVILDPEKFKQVFINLFGNATQYTPEGGSIFLDAKKGRTSWKFSVQDTGPGIPPEQLAKIFSKFYQVEKDYLTRKKTGTGLGLAIVKHLVKMHGGKVSANSEEGKGATFTVEIPHTVKIGEKSKQ